MIIRREWVVVPDQNNKKMPGEYNLIDPFEEVAVMFAMRGEIARYDKTQAEHNSQQIKEKLSTYQFIGEQQERPQYDWNAINRLAKEILEKKRIT